MSDPHILLIAYVGPETILPLTSVLAAIGGVCAMFWNTIRRSVVWCVRKLRGQPALMAEESEASVPQEQTLDG